MSVGNSRYLKIGPGGRKCNCCFPAPGSKDRRAQFRIAKRKAERFAMRDALAAITDEEILRDEIAQEIADEQDQADSYDFEILWFEYEPEDYYQDEPEELREIYAYEWEWDY